MGLKRLTLEDRSEPVLMYYIIYDLESRFRSLEEVNNYLRTLLFLEPRVPHTAMPEEDRVTKRVSVAPSIADCLNGINVKFRFRRCLVGEGAKDYNNDDEAYPVIVCSVGKRADFFQPDASNVSDVRWTNEYWTTAPTAIYSAELRWLGPKSIKVIEHPEACRLWCTSVEFIGDVKGKHHPWLDGKGHPLDCSDNGDVPFPRRDVAQQFLWYESFMGQSVVSVVPEVPYSGFGICYPVLGGTSYRARLSDCFKFTGLYDKDGEPIFDGDWVHCGDDLKGGTVDCSDVCCPKVNLDNSDNSVWLSALDFSEVRDLEFRYLREKEWFSSIFH